MPGIPPLYVAVSDRSAAGTVVGDFGKGIPQDRIDDLRAAVACIGDGFPTGGGLVASNGDVNQHWTAVVVHDRAAGP